MAPKKKQQQQQQQQRHNASYSSSSSKSKSQSKGPKLHISSENESRLRRLLVNTDRPTPTAPVNDSLSREQKAKKLRNIYEKLSCEGFTDDQIERALAALKDRATFEAALDWLCLNLIGNEIPLKFSSGASLHSDGGSVGIISTAREDWIPLVDSPSKTKDEMSEPSIKVIGRKEDDTLDSCQPSQADWIRQYLQQEEDDSETCEDRVVDEDSTEQVPEPSWSFDSIVKEYQDARLEAICAKERGDKNGQERAGQIIRQIKHRISALGISNDSLESSCRSLSHYASEEASYIAVSSEKDDTIGLCDVEGGMASLPDLHPEIESSLTEGARSTELLDEDNFLNIPVHDKTALEEEPECVELGNFFFEDTSSVDILPPEVVKLQKKERVKELYTAKNFQKLEGIWKKGDPKKIPKAVLHQLCQKSGWDAPKYSKVAGNESSSSYSVSLLRKATGRGKSRKAGGLISFQLPSQDETFETAEDSQNAVAAFALYRLFPEIPLCLIIKEPYASLVQHWEEDGEILTKVEDNKEDRRAGFVDLLLNADGSESLASHGNTSTSPPERFQKLFIEDFTNSSAASANLNSESATADYYKEESSHMRQEQENKKKTKRYKGMLECRNALPIAEMKGEILRSLKESNVLVICGETGCGKTTQVPQFILDDMIEAGCGAYCNIICTQPRRIAAISVAERVADERCESSPGSNDSLVGYQVRLDNARNERTKLLFCTTGILLRKMMGDKNLMGVTHIIVDEVHERSLLGDFLLIVLKSLLEKQSAPNTPKLKVILMSATVDSHLFSQYFGHCPVITAQGRTHPVSTFFLEDIYENMNYHISTDSPACIMYGTFMHEKRAPVGNHRGKKNLVLSAWGDDTFLSKECINPHYISSNYKKYNEQTRQNLRRLNEDVIDYDLLEDLVCHIDETYPEGSILVFLPGVAEIYNLLDRLAASYRFGGLSSGWILPLHSSIVSLDQKKVFLRPPKNIRKVIIATNIAETSITIDDVVYVVDCGKHKENRYNPQKKLSSMVEDWISRANAKQRRGRAGRVKPGICFCLYTCHRFENFMRPFQIPEMLRMPLVELCLQIKLLSLGRIKPFLSKALEPPKEDAVTAAILLLYEVGAITGDEELTPLGCHLAKLPVDVLVGKMMLYGAIFGCLSPILSISAFLSYKAPFVYPKDERQNVERAKSALLTNQIGGENDLEGVNRQSDHLLMMIAYKKWEKILYENGVKAAQQFCSKYFLSSSVMYMIRDMRIQFGTLLADIGLINLPKDYQIHGIKKEKLVTWLSDKSQPFNIYANHSSVVKAILCAGLYPNVAATEEGNAGPAFGNLKQNPGFATKGRCFWYDGKREVHIHPSSINSNLKTFQYPFLAFLEKVETNKIFLRDTTVISPYSILLFGGSIDIKHQTGLVIIDGWLKLAAPAQTAVLFKELRLTLHSVLKELIRKPQASTVVDNEVMQSMIHLLLEEEKTHGVMS